MVKLIGRFLEKIIGKEKTLNIYFFIKRISVTRGIISFFKLIFGTKNVQNIYEHLYQISLAGMNYGNGGDFKASGELQVINYIKKKLDHKQRVTIFDVGGNVGKYSMALSKLFGDNTTIHSFEPSRDTFEQFLKTTSGIPNIIPNNFGFSDTENNLTLYLDRKLSGLASLYDRKLDHFGISMENTEIIKLSTIDNYCDSHNIERIHFLKLDVEGHELSVLKGASEMIKK